MSPMTNPEITRAKATTGGAAMSDTPKTDGVCAGVMATPECRGVIDFARTLERENAQLRAERDGWKLISDTQQECHNRVVTQHDAALAKLEEAKGVIETTNHAMTWYCWHEQPDHDCMEYKAITRVRAFLDQPKGEQG